MASPNELLSNAGMTAVDIAATTAVFMTLSPQTSDPASSPVMSLVRGAQRILSQKLGHTEVKVDGILGPKTSAALQHEVGDGWKSTQWWLIYTKLFERAKVYASAQTNQALERAGTNAGLPPSYSGSGIMSGSFFGLDVKTWLLIAGGTFIVMKLSKKGRRR